MRVMVLGVRGIPGIQGGIETHAEHLYERLSKMGYQIDVIVRSPFARPGVHSYGSIRLRSLWAPKRQGLEALIHSIIGVLYAAIRRPDLLHIHAVGPAIVTPIARLLGLRVVVTHHGPDYDRDKWGGFARWILRSGESLGMRYADARIVISKVIADLVHGKYGVDSNLIPNGVVAAASSNDAAYVRSLGVEPGRYFLQVSRIVPEKRQLDLIEAYGALRQRGWGLVLVGGLDDSAYVQKVKAAARAAGVVTTGFLTGEPLQQVYSHAGAFVLPSSHEGLPIALLEALSYGLPVLASDIPANIEVGLEEDCYFRLGDPGALVRGLEKASQARRDLAAQAARRDWVSEKYDWQRIAEQTSLVYRSVLR